VYPLLAKHAVERDFTAMADDYRKGLRLIFIVNIPAAAGLVLLSEPIVRLLFQRGQFTAGETDLMAPLLALFAVGMPFFSMTTLTTRSFYAVKDTGTPVKMAAISFAINLGLTLALKDLFGAMGLVVDSTVAIIVQTLLLQWALAQKLPAMAFTELWRTLGKVFAATWVMGGTVWGGWWLLQRQAGDGKAADAIAIFGLIPLGVAVYAVMLLVLKIEGREELEAVWTRVRGKRASQDG
jgi:putative peptidoglycan lipid II flippase